MGEKMVPDLCSEKAMCCGCAACYSICPVEAISMIADEKGFWYPEIDEGICIRCQQCLNICVFKKDK